LYLEDIHESVTMNTPLKEPTPYSEKSQAEDSLRDFGVAVRDLIDAVPIAIAILDEQTSIVVANKAWTAPAAAMPPFTAACGVGENVLSRCDATLGADAEEARLIATGIRSLLESGSADYAHEYPCHTPDEQRWFIDRIFRITSPGSGRFILVHENITARKRIEAEKDAYLSQLRLLSDSLQKAREDERTWIAHEIHDEFGQSLTGLAIDLSLLKKKIGAGRKSVDSEMRFDGGARPDADPKRAKNFKRIASGAPR
jgi:signal transduction histidine kinase